MPKAKHVMILLLLTLCICSISIASAAENQTSQDIMANDNTIDSNDDELATVNEDDQLDKSEEQVISQDESQDILSAANTPSNYYSINLNDTYEIQASKDGSIKYYIAPCTIASYNAYNFYLVGFDKDNNIVYNTALKSSTTNRDAKNYQSTIEANSFIPGTYRLAAVNYDGNVMDSAVLKVKGTATITSNDYSAYYNSGKTMTAKATDKNTGKPLNGIDIKVTFTKGKKTTSKTYSTNAKGIITITPPAGVGSYLVTISSATPHVTAASIQKTAKVKKAPVKVKAYKVSEYKGFKITLKAKVTSQGKKVNEGTVKFKINGKTYKAKVKNGVATKKIKLKKAKKYSYTAKYSSSNYQTVKAAKSKATIKNRVATKIVVKNQRVYMNDAKIFTVKILTKSGKKVKNGKLKLVGEGSVEVKNGKAIMGKYGLGIKHLKKISGRTEYYKKTVTKSFKLKYVPTSHKYKASTKKVKVTSVFKCPGCGKTGTHNHYAVGHYVVYKTRIVVS